MIVSRTLIWLVIKIIIKVIIIKGKGEIKKKRELRWHKNTISIGNDLAYYLNMSE